MGWPLLIAIIVGVLILAGLGSDTSGEEKNVRSINQVCPECGEWLKLDSMYGAGIEGTMSFYHCKKCKKQYNMLSTIFRVGPLIYDGEWDEEWAKKQEKDDKEWEKFDKEWEKDTNGPID